MGKISTYTVLSTPTLNDKLIGTDVTTNNETKNFLISDLLALGVGGTGPTGPTGPQGIAGVTGPQGAASTVAGPIGPQGLQGIVGVTGAQGVTGATGIQGAVGPIGPAGLNWQGTYSPTGTYVLNDAVGFGGASYYNILACSSCAGDPSLNTTNWALLANIGATGPTGPTGPQGIQGLIGPAGVQGVTGATGAAGAQGIQGIQGLIGATGPQGITGATGATGAAGAGGVTTAGTNISITGLGTLVSPYIVNSTVPYSIYKVLLSINSGVFTVIQLENTIGDGSNVNPGDIQWSNPSNGSLTATKTGAFTGLKIFISVPSMRQSNTPYFLTPSIFSVDAINIKIFLHDGTFAFTPNLQNIPIEILVY